MRDLIKDWVILRVHSGVVRCRSQPALQATIIKTYHRIEKGLSLPEPRLGFGKDAVASLSKNLQSYLAAYGHDHATIAAISTLHEYVSFHAKRGYPTNILGGTLVGLDSGCCKPSDRNLGGTVAVSRSQILQYSDIDFGNFAESRHSVREYEDRVVDPSLIERAVAMAQRSPSVCNRQAGIVIEVRDRATQARLLAFQNGNRGFGHQADVLLIVAERLPCFLTVGERHQMWIDGGLFAMSLVYALHSLGLGTCCLNWSVERSVDHMFKKAANLSNDVEIIMLVTVGHLRDQFRVTQSPTRPIDDVLRRL